MFYLFHSFYSHLVMHQTFQKELYRFRIKTAKEFLRTLKTGTTPISTNPNEPLKLNAQVSKSITHKK